MATSLLNVCEIGMPAGDRVAVVRRRFAGGEGKRVAVVAGLRGDQPEGMRVALEVAAVLESCHERLVGSVDVYPCMNPLAAHRGVRTWPFFDQDLNRRFPGREDGHAPDLVAWTLVQEVADADLVIELRGAHPDFTEAAQARVHAGDAEVAGLARNANVQVVWARAPGPASASTFAWQHPRVVGLEGGTGNRLTPGVGESLAHGVLNILNVLEIFPDDALPFHWATVTRPPVVTDGQVHRLRAEVAGLFLPAAEVWGALQAGDRVGRVVDPITGVVRQEVLAPTEGRVLALRERPVVLPGTMVARLVEVSGGG